MMSDDWCPENDGAYRMELAARERDTITRLRARLEQAERERDEAELARDKWKQAWTDAGFRMGIEAAAKWLETVPQELQDRQIIVRKILALAAQKGDE